MNEPKPMTVYEHYKGDRYIVICVSTHTETGEKFVVYMSLGEEAKWWARPLEHWNQEVEIQSNCRCDLDCPVFVPRFEEIT